MAKDKKEKEPKAPKEKKAKSSKSKSGGGLQALLLKKGEWIALGGAGACLVLLLLWGMKQGAKAVDPEKESATIVQKASGIQEKIRNGKPEEKDIPPIPAWVATGGSKPTPATVNEFPFTGPLFDITARPDTKRDNPIVFGVDEFQLDLVKAPMKAYDIRQTGQDRFTIAVRTTKKTDKLDAAKVAAAKEALLKRQRGRGQAGGNPPAGFAAPPQQPGGGGPPGMGSVMGGMGSMGGAFGFGGSGGFDTNAERAETVINYVPLESLDTEVAAGKIPAPTIVPLRMVVIHATIPLKRQIEELKRALRLPSVDVAANWGPIYDGYEIQRREIRPNGTVAVDWPQGADALKPNYDFEEKYDEIIGSRKLADHFDSVAPNDPSEFYPYFLRYEQNLALPLPELVKELGAYPEIRLPLITETIKKMIAARRPAVTPSELAKRLTGKGAKEGRYTPQGSGGLGAVGLEGASSAPPGTSMGAGGITPKGPPGAPGGPPRGSGAPTPPMQGGLAAQQPIEVENLLLRFIDCDVKPGFTYEYRIRLKMKNPNYFGKDAKDMARFVLNPAWATDPKFEILYSPWVTLSEQVGDKMVAKGITIPHENFLFAYDPETYRKNIAEMYKGAANRKLLERAQAKDSQAVVQIQQWRQEVRTGDGKREPVGAWVVAEMPVGRGEYIGRKQYVRLPLWSSEVDNYVLREIPDKVFKGPKETEQPKGWLVDFSDQSVLVDFEGGKVRARVGSTDYSDDAAEELLILGRDGKLIVRSSIADEADPNRKAYTGIWETWLKAAEQRKSPTSATGKGGEFDGAPGGGGGKQ